MKKRILVAEDEPHLLRLLEMNLNDRYDVVPFARGDSALTAIEKEPFDLILSDIRLPGASGMDILRAVKKLGLETPIVLITAFGTVENAVEAMKLGAFDYLLKPVKMKELKLVVEKALRLVELQNENRRLRRKVLEFEKNLPDFVTINPKMLGILKQVKEIAPTQATVLIEGKSGTGKELIAQLLHRWSDRAEGPFVPINCAAIPADLLENELFGHEKGAFTGASTLQKGKFEQADGGTFFLDEVEELPLLLQAKLLRVLETHRVSRLGGNHLISVDVRVVAATNRNLRQLVEEGKFREDLFYRLNVVRITLPDLTERKDDIPVLAEYFLKRSAKELGKTDLRLSRAALDCLLAYDWPGNVRELENAIYRAALFVREGEILPQHLPEEIACTGKRADEIPRTKDELLRKKKELKERVIQDLERRFLENALAENNWNISRTARAVGMDRRQLQNLLRKHGVNTSRTARGQKEEGPASSARR